MNVIVTMHYAHRALSSPLTTRNIIKSGGQKVKSGDKLHYGPRGRNPGGRVPLSPVIYATVPIGRPAASKLHEMRKVDKCR